MRGPPSGLLALALAFAALAGTAALSGDRSESFIGYSEREAAAPLDNNVVYLHTQFGPIKIKLLRDIAPAVTQLVWELAEREGCTNCAFYRNEARPKPSEGLGPPYGLLQGRIEVSEIPPREGNIAVKPGHVCFIPENKDFFISLISHDEWGTSHTVWGEVEDWFAIDLITAQDYNKVTHPEFGTVMRMLKQESPFKISTSNKRPS